MNAPRFLAFAATALAVASAHAGFADRFKDPEDGEFDASEYLLDHRGVLPLPILITEPAVGYGGGVALMWFSESLRDVAQRAAASGGRITPPNIYGAMVAGTERTKMAPRAHVVRRGRWLYRGAAAAMDMNLDFYGVGNPRAFRHRQDRLQPEGRCPHPELVAGWEPRTTSSVRACSWTSRRGLTHRTRTRTHGARARQAPRSSACAGSTIADTIEVHPAYDETAVRIELFGDEVEAINVVDPLTGERVDTLGELVVTSTRKIERSGSFGTARGDVPFYQLPFIDMRGIPAARYQDENIGILEAEARYYVTPRWIVLGFAGAGRAWGRRDTFDDTNTQVMKGVGFRYLLARRLGLAAGIDVAWGPEKAAWYLSFGNSWK
jgi:hypothetical protein